VAEQVHIDTDHNSLQETYTICHCREGKDQHIACSDANVHRHAYYSEVTQINTQLAQETRTDTLIWEKRILFKESIRVLAEVFKTPVRKLFYSWQHHATHNKSKVQQETKFYDSSKCKFSVWERA